MRKCLEVKVRNILVSPDIKIPHDICSKFHSVAENKERLFELIFIMKGKT